MAHMLTVTTAGATQEFEVATMAGPTVDLVRTLFDNCQKGEVVEVPVRVPGTGHPGHLIVNPPNIASILIWEKDDIPGRGATDRT